MAYQAIAVFDIDGVIRDVSGSYRQALADTVEHFTADAYRPTPADIDSLKGEGRWNNDWEASQELVYRYFETNGQDRSSIDLDYDTLVDFFQHRYRGPVLEDPTQWTGYIATEPLLVQASYFDDLNKANIGWGFFSGATRGSATYVLEHRLGLPKPLLVAMHDAPGKPNPTGLFQVLEQIQPAPQETVPVLYAGDTVADMQTIEQAKQQRPSLPWFGVGILPPHVVTAGEAYASDYAERLQQAGANIVLPSVNDLTPNRIVTLCEKTNA
ncbi:MAG: TIGR01548 family HAD-type hydrolase [Cyanobacteria bacterium J06626_18]